MRFLLVDDSRTVHMFIKSCLSDTSFTFHDAYNGEEGLELLKSSKFDIILLDWEMPIMDGPTTLRAIREFNKETPIIMVTTKSLPDEIREAISAGANEYVMKPFTKEILAEKITSVTGRKVA